MAYVVRVMAWEHGDNWRKKIIMTLSNTHMKFPEVGLDIRFHCE
jgi:hypothetical protein